LAKTQFDHISDNELLEHFRHDGNPEWMGVLLDRYTLLLLGLCMKYLKDETEARDAVQQIFLKVLTEAGKYRIDYFKSWLYMVAKNYCLMKLRDKGSRNYRELTENHLFVDHETDKQSLLNNEVTYELLEEALNDLSDEQRQSVILFYLKKNSYQQIADKTGFSLLQVKSYIQNGKRNLRIILERKAKERQKK
jgi:RNA polymerase sigma-70 factor (ECF subfamily)